MTEQAPISWGDEIRPDSVWSWSHLGYTEFDKSAHILLIILSRSGSRYIMRATSAYIPRASFYPDQAIVSTPDLHIQTWEGIKNHVEWLKDDPAQTILMLRWPVGEGNVRPDKMRGMFMPEGTIGAQTRPVPDPVNPIHGTVKIRDAVSAIAAGWDGVWHSRYVFSNHLRQQVTGRVVDGLLANIERDCQALLATARPTENTNWKAKLTPIEVAAKALCGVCTGDPYVWARNLARNIDLDAFRLRLDQGQIPALNMAAKPWQPGATVAVMRVPPNTDVNAKKELVARWHDTNKATVEEHLLRWHDEVFLDPEPTYLPTDDHFHTP